MPSRTKKPPTFGQVWRWNDGVTLMLIHPDDRHSPRSWQCMALPSGHIYRMEGLDVNPAKTLPEWELLSEEDK